EGLGRRPWSVVGAEQQRETASAMSVSYPVVDGERAVDGFQRAGVGVLLPLESIERLNREEVRQPHPREDIIRVLMRRLLAEFARPLQGAFRARIPEMPPAQIEMVSLLIFRVPHDVRLRRAIVEQRSAETRGNGFRDLLLEVENIAQAPVVAVRPQLIPIR